MNLRQRVVTFFQWFASALILPGLLLGGALAQPLQAAELLLERTRFAPGEEIRVTFSASPDYAANAWVGIIPSSVPHGSEAVNDQYDSTYQYLNKRSSGVLVFAAPTQPGSYDLRMNDRDDNGAEVASVSFQVGTDEQGTLRLAKRGFAPGETIRVMFAASPYYAGNAWVGIIPSSIPHGSEAVNDQHDLTYQYLNKRTAGELVFTAPAQPGLYDLRMNDRDDNGTEVASVSFQVGSATLRLEKNTYAPGETIRVSFSASPDYAAHAWVGIIPSSIPHGSEAVNDQHDTTYQFLNKRAGGELVFAAPGQPGSYDFRMNDRDDNGVEVASVSFQVAERGTASLRLGKHSYAPGETILVSFTASPDYAAHAWVGIIPSSIPHGSEAVNDQHDTTYQFLNKRASGELVFAAPGQPGSYDFRMNDRDDNGMEVASVSFRVE